MWGWPIEVRVRQRLALPTEVRDPGRPHLLDEIYMIDTTDTNHAVDFMILGTPKQRRNIDIKGESPNGEPLKTFIWAPNVTVKIQEGERTIEGAIWANKLHGVGNSVAGTFDVAVPEDMPQLIYQRLGKEFGIGQRDYVAQGVTSWRSYGRTPD